MTATRLPVEKVGPSAAELARQEVLMKVFRASLADYEMGVRMRRHFRIGHRYWTLIPPE